MASNRSVVSACLRGRSAQWSAAIVRAACRHSRKSEHRHCGPPEQQVVEGALTRLQYQRGACLGSILCLARSESDVAASSSARWVHRRGSRRPLRPAMGAPLGRARLAGAPNRPVGFNVTRPGTMASQVFRTRRGALCAPASIGVAPTRIHHFVCRPLWPTSTIGAGQTVWVLANRPIWQTAWLSPVAIGTQPASIWKGESGRQQRQSVIRLPDLPGRLRLASGRVNKAVATRD